jgi:hypothetical protein
MPAISQPWNRRDGCRRIFVRFAGVMCVTLGAVALGPGVIADQALVDAGAGVVLFCEGGDGAGGSLDLYLEVEVLSPSNPVVPPPSAFLAWTDTVDTAYDIAFDAPITAAYEHRVLTASIPVVDGFSSEPAGDAQISANLAPAEHAPDLSTGVSRQGNLIFGRLFSTLPMAAEVTITFPNGDVIQPTGCVAEEFSGHFVFNNPRFWVTR